MTKNKSLQQESSRIGQPLSEQVYFVETREAPGTRWGSMLLEIVYALDDCERKINKSKCGLLKIQQDCFPVEKLKPSKEGLDKFKQELRSLEENIRYVKNCFEFYGETKSLINKANRALRKLS